MFHFTDLTAAQRRIIYTIVIGVISITAVFSIFPRSHADPAIAHPPVTLHLPSPSAMALATPAAMLVIDVAGKVLHPGVYRLPENSRAIDAIKMAGGVLKGVSTTDINLAHVLVDGEQIVVGAPAAPVSTTSKRSKGTTKSGKKSTTVIVNINTATAAQLVQLPGVGPVMASKIIAYRTSHGKFAATSEIASVPGFGKKRYEAVAKQLRI